MVFKEYICGGLNVIGPYKHIGSGTIKKCGFDGVSMALLEEVCHCQADLEASYTQDATQCHSLLPDAF